MTEPAAKKILFICTGNVCRSVMAERLLLKMAADRGLPWQARSCGIAAERFFRVPEETRKALASHGVPGFQHIAQLVSRDLLKWCDVALTMTAVQRERVLDVYPEFSNKTHLLRAYAGLDSRDVKDPISCPQDVYDRSCRDIHEALEAVLAKLAV